MEFESVPATPIATVLDHSLDSWLNQAPILQTKDSPFGVDGGNAKPQWSERSHSPWRSSRGRHWHFRGSSTGRDPKKMYRPYSSPGTPRSSSPSVLEPMMTKDNREPPPTPPVVTPPLHVAQSPVPVNSSATPEPDTASKSLQADEPMDTRPDSPPMARTSLLFGRPYNQQEPLARPRPMAPIHKPSLADRLNTGPPGLAKLAKPSSPPRVSAAPKRPQSAWEKRGMSFMRYLGYVKETNPHAPLVMSRFNPDRSFAPSKYHRLLVCGRGRPNQLPSFERTVVPRVSRSHCDADLSFMSRGVYLAHGTRHRGCEACAHSTLRKRLLVVNYHQALDDEYFDLTDSESMDTTEDGQSSDFDEFELDPKYCPSAPKMKDLDSFEDDENDENCDVLILDAA